MNTHLNDHEIAAAVAGLDLEPAALAHLEACGHCSREVEALRALLDRRRLELLGEAPDWEAQRRQVLGRLAPPLPKTTRLRPVLAAAAAVLVALTLSLVRAPGLPGDAAVSQLDVENILAEVDAVLADDSLPGFEAIDPGLDRPEDLFANGAS
jgi:anti-sigma factor RsiW